METSERSAAHEHDWRTAGPNRVCSCGHEEPIPAGDLRLNPEHPAATTRTRPARRRRPATNRPNRGEPR